MTLRELIDSIPELENADYDAIATHLNARPQVPNPDPQQQVPKPVEALSEIFAIVKQEYKAPEDRDPAVIATDMGVVAAIAQMIQAGNIIGGHVGIPATGNPVGLTELMQDEGFSVEAAQKIRDRLAETMPDPSWTETVPGESLAEQNGLGRVASEQVQGAFN